MSVSLPPRGRGTASNPHNRFAPQRIIASDDGWFQEVPPSRATEVRSELRAWLGEHWDPDRSLVEWRERLAASTPRSGR